MTNTTEMVEGEQLPDHNSAKPLAPPQVSTISEGKHDLHWQGPVTMIGSFIVGLLLAIGHHLFFKSLDGQPVPNDNQQAWNGRYVIAIVFLVKSFLGLALGTACAQEIWWHLRSRTTKLNIVDGIFGILENATKMLNFRVWLFAPRICLLALGAWVILPLSSISPPSTLTIQQALSNTSQSLKIPVIDYAINNFALGGSSAMGQYNGPTSDIARIVNAVATGGSILNLTEAAPCSHCQYFLNFYGPLLTCEKTSADTQTFINKYIVQATNNSAYITKHRSSIYASFVPVAVNGGQNLTSTMSIGISRLYAEQYQFIDSSSTDHARSFVQYQVNNSLECGLFNASYQAAFQFTNGAQSITIKNVTKLNGVRSTGQSTYLVLDTNKSNPGLYNMSTLLQNLQYPAYSAIAEAINTILIGLIDTTTQGDVITSNTRILSSSLSTAPELQSIVSTITGHSSDPRTPKINNTGLALADAISELSKNITVSLFSSPHFLQGADSATSYFAPEALTPATNTTVLLFTQRNVYVYKPKYLLLSYGIAVFYTFFSVLLGLRALYRNGLESYSNNFSTVLRTTRRLHLDSVILDSETTGSDPLPKHLANQVFTLKTRLVNGSYESVETTQGSVQNAQSRQFTIARKEIPPNTGERP